VKVSDALKIANVAVNNEVAVIDAAKTVAQVEVKEPKSVSAKTIKRKIELKIDEPAAVIEAKAPKTNEEREEENSS
jgi:hypothetical protein